MTKKLFPILRIVAIALGVAMCWSCCLDMDYDYDAVTPPVVSLDSPSVVGYITDKAGNPIVGATVQVGSYTATTDANGYYIIPNVTSGTYNVVITADGYITHNGSVDVEAPSEVFVIVKYSTTLAAVGNRTAISISAGGSGRGTVVSEHLQANDPAGIQITATVNSGTVDKSVQFYLIPIYDESQAETVSTKAGVGDKDRLLIGVTLSCSDPSATLKAPIPIELHCDVALTQQVTAKFFKNGKWVDIQFTANNGVIKINAYELGSYALFLPFIMTEKYRDETLTLRPQSVWDNLYGNGAITAESVSFDYSAGTRINTKANDVLTALLIEKIAFFYGAVQEQMQGVYPLNIRLPLGTRLEVFGYQNVTDVIASYKDWAADGTYFGETRITCKTTNRQHNGGSGGQY